MTGGRDNIAARLNFDATGASATAPAAVATGFTPTNSQLTANAAILQDGGDEDMFNTWQERAEAGVSPFDASIFAGELTEEALIANESWQAAAQILYDDRHGEGAWAAKVAEEGWSPEEAALELGRQGIERIANFNYQLLETGRTGFTIGDKPPEVQMAMLYMMEAFDHKNMTLGSFGRAAWKTITDPINAAMIVGGVVGSFFTFGGAGAAAAAGVAARQAATQAGKMAFMANLRSQIGGRIASSAIGQRVGTHVTGQIASSTIRGRMYSGIGSVYGALTSRTAVHAGRWGMVEGAAWGGAYAHLLENTQVAGYQSLGFNREYSLLNTGLGTAFGSVGGWGFGRVLGAVGPSVGRGFNALRGRVQSGATPTPAAAADAVVPDESVARATRGAAPDADESATRTVADDMVPDADEAATAATRSTPEVDEAATARSATSESDGAAATARSTDGDSSPPPPPGESRVEGLGLQPRARSGELLPDPRRTWLHRVFGKNNPYFWLASKFPNVKVPSDYMPSDMAFGAYIDPLINAIDDRLIGAHASSRVNIASEIQTLRTNLARIQDRLGAGTDGLTNEQAIQASAELIQNFQRTHGSSLRTLERSLASVADEMRLERDLAILTREAKLRIDNGNAVNVTEVSRRANELIDAFESSTGRTFRDPGARAARVESITRGSAGEFHLKDIQARAMTDYTNAVQRSISDLGDPNFAARYTESLQSALSHESPTEALGQAITRDFDFIFKESRLATMRSDPQNRIASQGVLWRRPADFLPDLNARRVALRRGYFNPHKRTDPIITPSSDNNLENIIMKIEEMDPSDTGTADQLAGLVKQGYDFGEEQEVIEAVQRLNDRAGRDGNNHALVEQLTQVMTRGPDYTAANAHYRYFVKEGIGQASSIRHSPYRFAERHIYQMYTDWTYKFRHARKYVYPGNLLSTPGEMFFKNDLISGAWNRPVAYFLGGNYSSTRDDAGKLVHSWNLWKAAPEDASGFAAFRHHAGQAAWRPVRIGARVFTAPFLPGWHATKFIANNAIARDLVMYPLGAGAAFIAAEEGLEAVLPENTFITDEEGNLIVPEFVPGIGGADVDIGSRFGTGVAIPVANTILMPLRANVWAVDELVNEEAIFDINSDWVSLTDNPVLDLDHVNRTWLGDRGEVSQTEALDALSQFQLVNGEVQPLTAGGSSLATIYNANDLADLLADGDRELTRESIQEAFDELSGSDASRSRSDDERADRDGGRDSERDSERDRSRDSSRERDGERDGGRDSDREERRERSAYGDRFRRASGGSDGWLAAGGDFVSGVARSATDWDNDGRPDGMMGQFGTFLSGGLGALGGFIGDLGSGRIAGGEGWLAGGIGILAGLIGTGILKSMIPGADKIPLLGLVLFGLIAGFGGKLAYSTITGQGSGLHRLRGTRDTESDHDGNVELRPRDPIVVAPNRPGMADEVIGLDEDGNGEWAPQLSMEDGRTFAPANLIPMTRNEITPAVVTQAQNDNMFIPDGYLPPEADEASEWEAEAVNHEGYGKVIGFRITGDRAANDPEYLILDVVN